MGNRKFSLIAQPNSIPYTDDEGNFSESWKDKFGSDKCSLQVTCSYNDDVLKGVAVKVDSNTIITKSNGLATFTGLDSGTKSITTSKDGFATNTSSKVIDNSFETTDIEMNPITLTFTVKDVENNVIVGALIKLGDYTAITNINGQAVISGILDGVYNYIITKATFANTTGIISINRQNLTEPVVMTSALIVGKSTGSFSVGDTVKLNAGMGENNYDFTAYPSDTTQINDLTVDGEVAEVKTDSIALTEEPQIENAEITIEADQDNTDIEFNNGNDICTVNIVANMSETHNYLAFTKDNSIIYFKDREYPFIASDNVFNEVSFTFYTYENDNMVSHTATTQSASVGYSTYDGTTLIIYSAKLLCNGTWTRDTADDVNNVETEYNDATIITSSYLTTPEAIIPTTNNSKFAIEKSNDWNILAVIDGAITNLANLQEIIVPSNTIVDLYISKNDGQPEKMFVNTYLKKLTITNDYIYRKVKFGIKLSGSALGATIKLYINNIEFVKNSLETVDVYAEETIYYIVEKDGYISQTGSYNCSTYPTIKENIIEVSSLIPIVSTNFTKVGTLTDDNGIISGFSSDNYILAEDLNLNSANQWSIMVRFKPLEKNAAKCIIGHQSSNGLGILIYMETPNVSSRGRLELSSNGSDMNIYSNIFGTQITFNMWQWLKLSFVNNQYLLDISYDGKKFNRLVTINNSAHISSNYLLVFGRDSANNFFNGYIDMNNIIIGLE